MSSDDEIRRRALTAMKAVTAGALLVAGVACSSDGDPPERGWGVSEDAGQDAEGDDTGTDTLVWDTGSECNDQESTGVCPEGCSVDEDVDCCNESSTDLCWSQWEEGFGCATICEGPFVPPEMPA